MNVFNVQQTGLEADPKFDLETLDTPQLKTSDLTENLINEFPVEVGFGGNKAYYRPSTDTIQLPERDAFTSDESLFSVLAHECAHATGHESRLNRSGITGGHSFGSKEYAKEELIAELTAAIVCDKHKVAYLLEHHASYLKSWLSALKGDSKFIYSVMNQASAAAKEVSSHIDPIYSKEQANDFDLVKYQEIRDDLQTVFNGNSRKLDVIVSDEAGSLFKEDEVIRVGDYAKEKNILKDELYQIMASFGESKISEVVNISKNHFSLEDENEIARELANNNSIDFPDRKTPNRPMPQEIPQVEAKMSHPSPF